MKLFICLSALLAATVLADDLCWGEIQEGYKLRWPMKTCYTSYNETVEACEAMNGKCKGLLKKSDDCFKIVKKS